MENMIPTSSSATSDGGAIAPAPPIQAAAAAAAADLSSVLPPPQACASCKHQRKKCGPGCLLAPYFPPERAQDFQCVHQVFGVSNVMKRLKSLPRREERQKAAEAMVWEAKCWILGDQVQGAYGEWLAAKKEAHTLRMQVQQYYATSMAAATNFPRAVPSTETTMHRHHHYHSYAAGDGRRPLGAMAAQPNYHHQHQQQPPLQQYARAGQGGSHGGHLQLPAGSVTVPHQNAVDGMNVNNVYHQQYYNFSGN